MLQLLIVLQVLWRSRATTIECFAGFLAYGFWSAVGPMPLGAFTCWLFGRSRGTHVLHIVVVLHVAWRSGATTIDCFAGSVALPCYNY